MGRRAELALLRGGLDVIRQGKGVSFLIAGEAGVGKTRLASEFTSELTAAGVAVVWGRCWEAGGAPSYWPWVEVIRRLVGSHEITGLGRHGLYLAQLVPDLADRFGAAGLPAPTPSDPESARFLMFDSVSALLRRCTAASPLAIVIDDLHAADRASLLLLTFLARRSADVPLLIIGTLRDRGFDLASDLLEPIADFARQGSRVELGGLTRGDISCLLEVSSSTDAQDELAGRIHDATAGNAFFVDEILRSLASTEVAPGGTASLDLRVPSGVRDAVRQRLGAMTAASVDVLELSAVVGREFDVLILSRALDRTATEVLEALEHPIELGIVEKGSARAGRLRFRHALIRDALYESIPVARRGSLHRLVGEAFEALAESAPDRHVGELAHHFLIAAGEGDGRFIQHAVRAAQRAIVRMAFEEAVALYQRTLDTLGVVQSDARVECELLLGLAEAKEWANDVAGSRRCFEQAADVARNADATDLFVRAALGVGAVAARKFTATSRYESAPLLIQEALRRGGDADSATKALLLSRLALHHLTTGERDEANRLSIDAVTIARGERRFEALVEALIARHSVLFGPDNMEERRAIADEVLSIGSALLRADLVMRGHALRFTVRFESCDVRGADLDLEQHRILAESLSDPFDRWANLVWRGGRSLLEGRFAEAQEYADRAIQLCFDIPGPHSAEVNGPAAYAGQTILIQDTATRDLPGVLATTGYDSRFPEMSVWQAAAIVGRMRAGDAEGVRVELERLGAHGFRNFERNGVWLMTMSILSEAIAFVGDRERAAIAYSLLQPYAHLQGTASLVASCGSISRHLGLLAATLDLRDDADRHFAMATEMNRAMGAQPHLAKTLLDHGRLLLDRTETATAERGLELVRRARAMAIDLEMPGLLQRCDSILNGLKQPAKGTPAAFSTHALVKVGDVWMIHHAGTQTPVGHTKGLAYIAELLRHPNREILAIDLIRALNAEPSSGPPPARSDASRGIVRRRRHFTEDVVDARARRAYERRLVSLEVELSSAEAAGDPERVIELRDEIDQLERELSRTVGLRGRARQSSDVERARISVTRAIHLALGRIAEAAPEAGVTLARCVRTGTYCCYAPDEAQSAAGEFLEMA